MIRALLLILAVVVAAQANLAYGHFPGGTTKNIDKYQVIFAPNPANPAPGDNSTLNFSVLENNTNIYNIHAAVLITERQSGDVVAQVPYRLYEFSDITVPYTFEDSGDYVVTLQTRIIGDEKYEASFDISVGNQIPFDELMLLYVTPAAVAIAGIAIYLRSKKKL